MTEEIGGGVPITDEILPTQREYFPNYYEWLFKDKPIISKGGYRTSGGRLDLYTVPKNHELHIIHTHLSVLHTGGVSFNSNMDFSIVTSSNDIIHSIYSSFIAGGVFSQFVLSDSHATPIKVNSEEKVSLFLAANYLGFAGFIGYLVKKNIL